MLDQDEAWLEEIALDMEPEDGRLWICDLDDDIAVTAFTPFGVESLKELIEINKDLRLSNKVATPRGSPQGYGRTLVPITTPFADGKGLREGELLDPEQSEPIWSMVMHAIQDKFRRG